MQSNPNENQASKYKYWLVIRHLRSCIWIYQHHLKYAQPKLLQCLKKPTTSLTSTSASTQKGDRAWYESFVMRYGEREATIESRTPWYGPKTKSLLVNFERYITNWVKKTPTNCYNFSTKRIPTKNSSKLYM